MVKKYINHIKPALFAVPFVLLLIVSVAVRGQEYPGYSTAVLSSLNTAIDSDYLTDTEKEVVLMLNMIRHDGTLFWNTVAEPYIRQQNIQQSRYTRSLEKDLKSSGELPLLHPDKTLYGVAQRHAVASGKEGKLGHTSSAGTFEQRLKPLIGEFNYLLENSDYGSSEAVDIIMNLMIDEGIPDVGHRKNILNENVNAVGVAIAPHRTYRHTCVQVFGQKLK